MNLRIPGERQDEVGLLGRSFNAMLQQIGRLLSQVREEQRLKREAELRSLQAHIQPHFLYNTLDTIQWLARKDGAKEAAEMVEALSKLFRIGLSKGQETIPLADELEHIRSYLKIQKTRYKDKLNYEIEAGAIRGDTLVLKLILQPVVENAIYHGIKERRGPGHIAIRVSERDGVLEFTVEDDGVGMSEERLAALRGTLESPMASGGETGAGGGLPVSPAASAGSSYGLRNVQERIRLTFGESYGISVESKEKQGTRVTIRHPIIDEKGLKAYGTHVESFDSR